MSAFKMRFTADRLNFQFRKKSAQVTHNLKAK